MKKKSPLTHFRLGQMYMIKKDYIRARLEFRKTIHLKDDMWEAYHKLGDSCMVLGEFDEALDCYEKAYEHYKEDGELAMSLAICYDNKGETQKAVDVLEQLKRQEPDYTMVNYNLAYGYNQLEDYRKALECIEDELKYFPENEMAIELKESIEEKIKENND